MVSQVFDTPSKQVARTWARCARNDANFSRWQNEMQIFSGLSTPVHVFNWLHEIKLRSYLKISEKNVTERSSGKKEVADSVCCVTGIRCQPKFMHKLKYWRNFSNFHVPHAQVALQCNCESICWRAIDSSNAENDTGNNFHLVDFSNILQPEKK